MGNSGKELAATGAFMDKQALSKCKKVEDARLGGGGMWARLWSGLKAARWSPCAVTRGREMAKKELG